MSFLYHFYNMFRLRNLNEKEYSVIVNKMWSLPGMVELILDEQLYNPHNQLFFLESNWNEDLRIFVFNYILNFLGIFLTLKNKKS